MNLLGISYSSLWRQTVRRRRKSTSHWESMPLRRNVGPFFFLDIFLKIFGVVFYVCFLFEFNLSSWNGITSTYVLIPASGFYCLNCLFTLPFGTNMFTNSRINIYASMLVVTWMTVRYKTHVVFAPLYANARHRALLRTAPTQD